MLDTKWFLTLEGTIFQTVCAATYRDRSPNIDIDFTAKQSIKSRSSQLDMFSYRDKQW